MNHGTIVMKKTRKIPDPGNVNPNNWKSPGGLSGLSGFGLGPCGAVFFRTRDQATNNPDFQFFMQEESWSASLESVWMFSEMWKYQTGKIARW